MSSDANNQAAKCPVAGTDGDWMRASMMDYEIQARPNIFYNTLRNNDRVHYDEKLGMYLISSFEDIQTVVRDPITFSVERGYTEQYAKGYIEEFKAILREKGGGFFPDAVKTDPPYHTRIRRLIEKAFTAHRVKELEPSIIQVVNDV